jgi:carboxylesterase
VSKNTNTQSLHLSGNKIGVLLLHGFLGSPASIAPWAQGIHSAGFTVSAPRLEGHGTDWHDLAQTTWSDWYLSAEEALLELKKSCEQIFVAGFDMGGALALRLAQIRGSEIEALILLNPSIGDEGRFGKVIPLLKNFIHSVKNSQSATAAPDSPADTYSRIPLKAYGSLQKLWKRVTEDLYLVDIPMLICYSENDQTVSPISSEIIMDEVYSPIIREVVFEKSLHNVAHDFEAQELIDESNEFIFDVLSGNLEVDDETELINAEFDSIVSGLSLDESSPTTYLDELDRIDDEHFVQPNPPLPTTDHLGRVAIAGLIGGPVYLLIEFVTGFDLLGFGPWPGILAFIGGVVTSIVKFARPDDDFEDGAIV